MSQMNEFKREIQEAKKLRLSWQAKLIIFLVGAPLTFLFAIHGRLALALPLMITTGVLGLVILLVNGGAGTVAAGLLTAAVATVAAPEVVSAGLLSCWRNRGRCLDSRF